MRKLTKALKEQKKTTQQVDLEIYGSLGIPIGGQKTVEVPTRQSYVYVRLRDNQNEVVQAFNNKVAPSYNLPVILTRDGNRYTVQGVNTQRYENNWNNSSPYLPRHGISHSFPEGSGGDIAWIFERQIMPALVYPNTVTGSNVKIYGYPFLSSNNIWKFAGNTGTDELIQYRPTTGSLSVMALVYLDANTGNPGLLVNSGTQFSQDITGSNVYQYLPVPQASQIPLAGIRLSTGTSEVSWENIYGTRQWIQFIPTGTGGSAGGILGFAGLYNGVPIGTGTFLNVRGDNVVFTKSGSMFDLFITGTAGSGINTGTLDDRYLKLNTSNDPLRGQLDITPTGSPPTYSLNVTSNDKSTIPAQFTFNTLNSGVFTVNNPVLSLFRKGEDTVPSFPVFAGPFIYMAALNIPTGSNAGGLLKYDLGGGITKTEINPHVNGTGTSAMLDTAFTISPNGLLLLLKNNGNPQFYVNASGTAYSNGEPLIKEAPVNGTPYARKDAGWQGITGTYPIESGEYAPVFSSGTNTQTVQGVGNWKYVRVGGIVTVSGPIQIDTGAIGAFTCFVSLPIPSNFTASNDASGNGTNPGAGTPDIISVREDQTNDRLQLDGYAQVATNLFYRILAQYIIK